MLGSAAFDAAQRKVKVAAEVKDPGELNIALLVCRDRFGRIKHRQRLVDAIGDAHAPREADLRLAALQVVSCRPQ